MPPGDATGTPTGEPTSATPPNPTPTPTPTPSDAAPSTGVAGGSGPTPGTPATPSLPGSPGAPPVPGAGAPAPVVPAQPTWLESLRSQGVDLGGDEQAALAQIAQTVAAFKQIQPLTPYLHAFAQHGAKFNEWMQQQGAARPAAAANDPWHKEFWNPPEFNPQWVEQYAITDAQGNRGWGPNTPPEVVAKYNSFKAYTQDQTAKMVQNPFEYFGSAIQKLARQEAEKLVKENFSRHNDLASSQSFIQQNANWLYEVGPDGRVLQQQQYDPASNSWRSLPVQSQWGQAFGRYVQQIAAHQQRYGYSDIESQKTWALQMVERDRLAAWYYQQQRGGAPAPGVAPAPGTPAPGTPAPSPQAAANAAFLAGHNPPAGQPPVNGNSRFQDGPPITTKAELEAAMKQGMLAVGAWQ